MFVRFWDVRELGLVWYDTSSRGDRPPENAGVAGGATDDAHGALGFYDADALTKRLQQSTGASGGALLLSSCSEFTGPFLSLFSCVYLTKSDRYTLLLRH